MMGLVTWVADGIARLRSGGLVARTPEPRNERVLPLPSRDFFGDRTTVPAPDPFATLRAKLREAESSLSWAHIELEATQHCVTVWRRMSMAGIEARQAVDRELALTKTQLEDANVRVMNLTAGMRLAIGGVKAMRAKGGPTLMRRLLGVLGES